MIAWGHRHCHESHYLRHTGLDGKVRAENLVVHGDITFGIVSTPCDENGAYNYIPAVVALRAGVVRRVRLAGYPASWRSAEGGERLPDFASMMGVWNPSLAASGGTVTLVTGLLGRGLGDSGYEVSLHWQVDHFEPVEVRVRGGGDAVPEHIGPFPIIAPEEKRCSASFEADRATGFDLVLRAGHRRRREPLGIVAAGCARYSAESVRCAVDGYELAITSNDADWVVVQIDDREGEVEVLRVPRNCDLGPGTGPI
jgi:hypothetical protein